MVPGAGAEADEPPPPPPCPLPERLQRADEEEEEEACPRPARRGSPPGRPGGPRARLDLDDVHNVHVARCSLNMSRVFNTDRVTR